MNSTHIRWVAAAAVVTLVAWPTYKAGGVLLMAACLALICVGIIGWLCIRASGKSAGVLHDPAVSTLVFPPESKFERSTPARR